jgi:hypothetical protein
MPTGYTSDIEKGITFEQFALSCARNFGALVSMRDEPHDAPIPDEFTPSSYNADNLLKAQKELGELKALPIDECEKRAMMEYKEELERHEKYLADKRQLQTKYETMLSSAKAWTPPTPDHQGLKEFMIQQIEESIKWDCGTSFLTKPKLLTATEWLNKKTEKALHGIEYHSEENAKEVQRTNERTSWVRELKKSLKGQMSS